MSGLTFKQKQAHYEKIRRSNYLASLRLSGFDTSPTDLNKPLISREQALEKYRESKTVEPDFCPSLSE
ncbi:YhfG family protein [Pseudomonas fluorescens]|uniref:YhfG family protein n=1 Tax=Pseudomonas fluorescens TaxID=294 RepID=UPI00123FE0B0|nr:YhfG family protein [Pseudomonas fluorescens]